MSRPRNPLVRLGLKHNPFSRDIPIEACRHTPEIEHYCRRVENQCRSGGFCMIVGPPGTGKSIALRLLANHLAGLPDTVVRELTRPQTSVHDFYRELGDLFAVRLSPSNRYGGTKILRQRWQEHVDTSLRRPVLLVDEAQEMQPAVLNELRLMSTARLDSCSLLTVVLAGDDRLPDRMRTPTLQPLASRIRVRLSCDHEPVEEMAMTLRHALEEAGNPALMTTELITVLAEHSAGNLRAMMNVAHDLLDLAIDRDLKQLDEQHFIELASLRTAAPPSSSASKRRTPRAGS